jgi:hypothetical protein
MTEATVSFAGNLTDQPEIHNTDCGIARAVFPSRSERPAGAGAVVLYRDRVARPGRACRRVTDQGQPGRGRGSASTAGMDRRGWQRPIRLRCRPQFRKPAVEFGFSHTAESLHGRTSDRRCRLLGPRPCLPGQLKATDTYAWTSSSRSGLLRTRPGSRRPS